MEFNGMDLIRVTGVRGTGYHGVYDFEREQGQEFVVDVTLGLKTQRAAATDALTNTVDYGEIALMVHRHITGEPVSLLETLALRIAEDCLRDVAVRVVEVTVHKPAAPVDVPFDDISLTITRTRS
jgi:dihydroneopterin aldolase